MTARLTLIQRYPIKAIGGEVLDQVTLTAGQVLPGDRAFAVLHADSQRHLTETGGLDRWLPKSAFLRGVAGPQLQAIRGRRLPDGRLQLRHPQQGDFVFDPGAGDALLAWLAPLWPDSKAPPLRLVSGPVALTDRSLPLVSVLSLTSLRALEDALAMPLGTDRWRGNLWLEGLAPWVERDLIGQRLRIGGAVLEVCERIGRCAATDVDTQTGTIQLDMLAALKALQGDEDFGVYAQVVCGGRITSDDQVEVLP